MKTFPFCPLQRTVHACITKYRKPPLLQISEISMTCRRYLQSCNALKPDYGGSACPCTASWTWKRQREGELFCMHGNGEPLSQYEFGGYYPLDIGDTLLEGRYSIVTKLGWGRDAITWLAKDSRYSRVVAIKVFRSEIWQKSEEEAAALKRLTMGSENHLGKKHVIQLIDRFDITGPNGRHLCLIFEALGPRFDLNALSPIAAWEVARQMVEAVAYAHSMGIPHGDLRLEKFIFTDARCLHQYRDPQEHLMEGEVDPIQPVNTLANVLLIHASTQSPHVPKNLVACPTEISKENLTLWNDGNPIVERYRIKLLGFGNKRVFEEEQWFADDNYLQYQAPEVLMDAQLSPKADIWSLGCLIFEVLGGSPPFHPSKTRKGLMTDWLETFGNPPEKWANRISQDLDAIEDLDISEDADGLIYPDDLEDSDALLQPGQNNMIDHLKDIGYSRARCTSWYSKRDLEALGDLLVSMTQYRPSNRPSADEVLRHPLFTQRPSFAPIDGTFKERASKEREIAAYALDKAAYFEKWNLN